MRLLLPASQQRWPYAQVPNVHIVGSLTQASQAMFNSIAQNHQFIIT
jgi:hypothetical protein